MEVSKRFLRALLSWALTRVARPRHNTTGNKYFMGFIDIQECVLQYTMKLPTGQRKITYSLHCGKHLIIQQEEIYVAFNIYIYNRSSAPALRAELIVVSPV